MDDKLREIEERVNAATPGPWKVIEKGNTVKSFAVVTVAMDGKPQEMICPNMSPKTGNADFVAHAREDIPFLLAEVKRMKAKLDAAMSIRTPKPAIPHKAEEPTKIGNVTFGKGVTIWNCPTCGILITQTHKYCWKCGQALSYTEKGE